MNQQYEEACYVKHSSITTLSQLRIFKIWHRHVLQFIYKHKEPLDILDIVTILFSQRWVDAVKCYEEHNHAINVGSNCTSVSFILTTTQAPTTRRKDTIFSRLYLVMKSHNPLNEEAKRGKRMSEITFALSQSSTTQGKASMLGAHGQQQC